MEKEIIKCHQYIVNLALKAQSGGIKIICFPNTNILLRMWVATINNNGEKESPYLSPFVAPKKHLRDSLIKIENLANVTHILIQSIYFSPHLNPLSVFKRKLQSTLSKAFSKSNFSISLWICDVYIR